MARSIVGARGYGGGRRGRIGLAALGAGLLVQLVALPALAQSLKDLTGALGGSGGSLGGLGLPAVDEASPTNLAGVLQYCMTNNYLGGGDAEAVQQSLLGKLGGSGEAARDPGFEAGLGGLLDTGGGETFSLGGSGIQEKLTDEVCDLVLEHAQSLL